VLAVFLFGFLLIYRTIHSPFGQVLKSIRENEPRAMSLGLATLTDVSWQMSAEVVLMTLLGGMGTILGPVLGATAIVAMQNYLSQFGS
jgi:branched-chain amino acid transport system permease protein